MPQNRNDLLGLRQYELADEPLPDKKREQGRSAQATLITFVDSGMPAARVVDATPVQRVEFWNAVYALNLADVVSVHTRYGRLYLKRRGVTSGPA